MSQIFISYRREGGEIMAQLLYDKLIARGYTVFYDVESLKSGRFDSKLLEEIEKAEDFLLILPPGGLDRCVSEEDWVRQEIRSAIEHKKNIVPIMLRGFSFPTNLPEDIGEIARYNGVNFGTMEFFDAKIQRILERLKSVSSLADSDHGGWVDTGGYESFRQRLMVECEELLETAQHHWSKIVADSGSFAPIEHPVDRARIRLLLEDIEKWREKKKDFEAKANSSIDIYGTAYIQEVFHRLEGELAQIAPYETVLLQYAALFDIEESLYALSVTCREDYETLATLRTQIEALPEDVVGELRAPAREILDALWCDYENQLTFEKGAALLEQMLLNLSFGMEEDEPRFALDQLATVRSDVDMAENILTRFDALYAQCAPEDGSERTPLFVEKYQKYIDRIPVLKVFVERGKHFIVAGTLCEDILRLNKASALTADALAVLIDRRAALSAEAAAYMDPAISEALSALFSAGEKTAALVETASRLAAERYDGETPLADIPYRFDEYEAAHAAACAVETWAEACLSLAQDCAALSEQRFFKDGDLALFERLHADAKGVLADEARPTAAQLDTAHTLEEKLVAKCEEGVLDPEQIRALHAELSALPALVCALISPTQTQMLQEEVAALDAYGDVVRVRDWLKENAVQLVFENHSTIERAVSETTRLHTLLSTLEEKVAALSTRFAEIRLPMDALREDMRAADEYVESTVPFFSCYTLYEWQVAHPDVAAVAEESYDELKGAVDAFRAQKNILGAYDVHGETRKFYDGARAVLRRASRKKRRQFFLHVIVPILLPILWGALVAADILVRKEIMRNDLGAVFLLAYTVISCLSLITLRKIPAFRTPLFLLPSLAYTAYAFLYAFPAYLRAMHFAYTELVLAAGIALLALCLAAFAGHGTGFARFFGVISLLVLIFVPLIAFVYPMVMAYEASYAESFIEYLTDLSRLKFEDFLTEGARWLVGTLSLGGYWMEDYTQSMLTQFTTLFYLALLIRIPCRIIVRVCKKREAQSGESGNM